MRIQLSTLTGWGFTQTHKITAIIGSLPEFVVVDKSHPSLKAASVYVWGEPIGPEPHEVEVLYVGKAGYGVKRRFSQHRGGFRNRRPGDNCGLILDKLAAQGTIHVYAKVAASLALFGVNVPAYSTEEEALCERLAPQWNRASFPRAAAPTAPAAADAQPDPLPIAPDAEQLPGDLREWLLVQSEERQQTFLSLLRYVASVDTLRDLPQKFVGGYAHGQPKGYNGVPMLVFGEIGAGGRVLPLAWHVRIPLTDDDSAPLTIFIPRCFLRSPEVAGTVESHGQGNQAFFRPVHTAEFLRNPDAFVDWRREDTR